MERNHHNNHQDDGSDRHRKRPFPACLDEHSKPQKKPRFPPFQFCHGLYDININQHRSSDNQFGANFTHNSQLPMNLPDNSPTSNNNLFDSKIFPSSLAHVLGLSQFPKSESNSGFIKNLKNPSSSNLVESNRQRENPEGEGYRSCNCKKSNCLSLHCACFANKQYCVDCKCQGCENHVENEHEVSAAQEKLLAKNPSAFDSQIIGDEHKKGCSCKNSSCKKRYCACMAHNVKCTSKCRCMNCKNPIGTKDYGVLGEVNTQGEQNNMTTSNVPMIQHPVPIQCPNYGRIGNSENHQMYHAFLPVNLEAFLASQPPHYPSNSHCPSIKDGVGYATVMPWLQEDSNKHDSLLYNNCTSGSRSGTLINVNNEINHDTVSRDVHANATLNTQHLIPFSETLPNEQEEWISYTL